MGDLQVFFESTTGKITSAAIIAALLLIIFMMGHSSERKEGRSATHKDTMALALSSMFIAASLVLSNIKLFSMPQGGTVTPFSMLPIALCSYLIGTRSGVMAGTALGMLNLMINPYVIHPLQLLLDYPIAFAALGMGGPLRNTKAGLPGVYLVGIFGRFICSTLSGVVFFASYAEGTGMSPLLYSVVYNGTYIGAEGALTLIILLLPPVRSAVSRIKAQLSDR
ncbi:MAG: energy-coupled thiamine transporter ThiT [Eubacterium sp.]|nr:energy-coupled thiamine transporter ThiT [Eubacterium sp.]